MKFIIYILSIVIIFSFCNSNNHVEHIERAFYFWKSDDLDDDLMNNIKKLKVTKLYCKLFEVDYSEAYGNYPFCKNRLYSDNYSDFDTIKIIPTVFIKNTIFQYSDFESLKLLADNIAYLVEKYSFEDSYDENKEIIFSYDEIHIDCDWTKSSKEKYFFLLGKLKECSKKKISCTLRLYPYKHHDVMGIPPVDKVTLMCYNLIKPLKEQNKNSILDIVELKKYLNERKSYPLHLDIALPTFYWTQHYQNNHFIQLVELSTKYVRGFAKQVQPLWYQIEKDTSINEKVYLKVGDQLKCEDVATESIYEAINIIKKYVKLNKNTTIILFDLDQSTFNQYSNEEITNFYNNFY
jgi:hypothetical protein